MSGLEVEEVEAVAPPFSHVVVANVVEVAKHPNADRLNVCQVDVGTGTLLNIVCGAPNVRAGMKGDLRHGRRRVAAWRRWQAVRDQGGPTARCRIARHDVLGQGIETVRR